MSKKKIALKVVISIVLVIILALAFIAVSLISKVKKSGEIMSTIKFNDINISTIQNGTYIGEFDASIVYAKAQVTVNNGKITDIKLLEHRNGKGQPAESIINTMMEKQTTQVDSVSGATLSSKVIKKAVENALTLKK